MLFDPGGRPLRFGCWSGLPAAPAPGLGPGVFRFATGTGGVGADGDAAGLLAELVAPLSAAGTGALWLAPYGMLVALIYAMSRICVAHVLERKVSKQHSRE